MHDSPAALDFVLKVAARCNLNCSYCYVFNKGDDTWRERSRIMSDEVFAATIERIRRHCRASGQRSVGLTFHGGEPCLVGPQRFASWCGLAREILSDTARVRLAVQTNGTLLDDRWVATILAHDVRVSVSMDGPKHLHDAYRVNHRGGGSYDAVVRGLGLLREAGIPLRVLSVIQFGEDGLSIHRHFLELGVAAVDYLLPDFTHDTISLIRARYGPTPCADFLMPILEDWWHNGDLRVRVGLFWHMTELILGGSSRIDALGNRPFQVVFVETDGEIEGLDVLRVCGARLSRTGLNVADHDFAEIADASDLHRASIFKGIPTPGACHGCRELRTCGGGYLPHRHSRLRGFDNPSVWCEDLLCLFDRLRELLGVSVAQTALRRQLLIDIHTTAGAVGAHPM
jgi:uncharacterized protein